MESLNLTKRTLFLLLSYILILVLMTSVNASEIRSLNSFSSGSPAIAADVNSNFTAVTASVNDNNSRIAQLEQLVATLQAELTAVKNNSVLELDNVLTYATDNNGYPTALFSGVNVQVINGIDQTTPNGVGNIVVGYNNSRGGVKFLCSYGIYTDETSCIDAAETWAVNHKSGSHNLVAGDENSYSQTGGVVFGNSNAISSQYANVTGGYNSHAIGFYSVVSGGALHTSSGYASSVFGGVGNTASGFYSVVSGGRVNTSSGRWDSVSGGQENTSSGDFSSISGGRSNTASGDNSSVSGGNTRSATGIDDWRAGTLFETQ